MIARSFLVFSLAGLLLAGCSQSHVASVNHPASVNPRSNRYQFPNRESDVLGNYGVGKVAGIPDNPTVGRYPGAIELPVTPLMGIGD